MSAIDIMLRRIDGQMTELARQALIAPQQRDAFEYGRVCGMYAGMSHVKDLVVALATEEDERNI